MNLTEQEAIERIRNASDGKITMRFDVSPETRVSITSTNPDEAEFIAKILWMNTNLEQNLDSIIHSIDIYIAYFEEDERMQKAVERWKAYENRN